MIKCPECSARHYPGTLFCDNCGAAIHPAAQEHVAGLAVAAARHQAAGDSEGMAHRLQDQTVPEGPPLRVVVPHRGVELTLDASVIHVGRADPESGYVPELDLTAYDGLDRGVSRRHAIVRRTADGITVVDRHSSNGTWLDGRQLEPGRSYEVPQGATLRFGDLLVQLSITN